MATMTSNRPAAADKQPHETGIAVSPLRDLVLVRIACDGGATRAETIRDLGQMVAHRFSPGEWRQTAEDALVELVATGLASEKRGRYEATAAGTERAAMYLVLRQPAKLGPWTEVRDAQLIARALGLEAESTPKLKALGTPDGLRAEVVQRAYGLARRLRTSPAKLRAEGVSCSAEALQILMNYNWPGNVRELENAVEHALICAVDGTVKPESLPETIRASVAAAAAVAAAKPAWMPAQGAMASAGLGSEERSAAASLTSEDDNARRVIEQALLQANGNRSVAAKLLGVDRTTLWGRMQRRHIPIPSLS